MIFKDQQSPHSLVLMPRTWEFSSKCASSNIISWPCCDSLWMEHTYALFTVSVWLIDCVITGDSHGKKTQERAVSHINFNARKEHREWNELISQRHTYPDVFIVIQIRYYYSMLTLEDKRKRSYAFTICMHIHAHTHILKYRFVQMPWIRKCVCVNIHSKEKHTETYVPLNSQEEAPGNKKSEREWEREIPHHHTRAHTLVNGLT